MLNKWLSSERTNSIIKLNSIEFLVACVTFFVLRFIVFIISNSSEAYNIQFCLKVRQNYMRRQVNWRQHSQCQAYHILINTSSSMILQCVASIWYKSYLPSMFSLITFLMFIMFLCLHSYAAFATFRRIPPQTAHFLSFVFFLIHIAFALSHTTLETYSLADGYSQALVGITYFFNLAVLMEARTVYAVTGYTKVLDFVYLDNYFQVKTEEFELATVDRNVVKMDIERNETVFNFAA